MRHFGLLKLKPVRADLAIASLVVTPLLAGCVSTGNTEDDCPGDSVLINGQCVGVDENGDPK